MSVNDEMLNEFRGSEGRTTLMLREAIHRAIRDESIEWVILAHDRQVRRAFQLVCWLLKRNKYTAFYSEKRFIVPGGGQSDRLRKELARTGRA
jgi:hypothetical protein